MKDEKYIPNVGSKEEFLERFNKLYEYLDRKESKSTAENELLKHRLMLVKDNIEKDIPLLGKKDSYCNMLPFFEMGGGWEMMESETGKEATDLLYYFVQNY